MITLYTWMTPNGRKISILLEELGLPYTVRLVDLAHGDQFSDEFTLVSPNNKIPAIVDHDVAGDPMTVFESGAIMTYLAEKTGRFLPTEGRARVRTLEWLHWQIGGLGPALIQLGHYALGDRTRHADALARHGVETARLLDVMERRLTVARYLGGDEYTIADMASYPWVLYASRLEPGLLPGDWSDRPYVRAWLAEVGERAAVQRGMTIPVS